MGKPEAVEEALFALADRLEQQAKETRAFAYKAQRKRLYQEGVSK